MSIKKKKTVVAVVFEHINNLIDDKNKLQAKNALLEKRLKLLELNINKLLMESKKTNMKHKYLKEQVGNINNNMDILKRRLHG